MEIPKMHAGRLSITVGGIAASDIPGELPTEASESTYSESVLYENGVSSLAETELDRLYGNMFSSIPMFRACGVIPDQPASGVAHDGSRPDSFGIGTYTVRRDGKLSVLWLYRNEGANLRVLNEGMYVSRDQILQFARHSFARYAHVDTITLHAVIPANVHELDGAMPYPVQRYNCLEDIVLTLPADLAAYRESLGKSTRNYLNRYLNKLAREKSYRHLTYAAQEIQAADLLALFNLNRARMKDKGKISIIDDSEAQRITRLARERGLLSVIEIDGRICAGTLQYRMGDNYFMEVIGHDSAYDEYRLGTLSCYLAISACIALGAREYHFLWGQNDYKFRLGGIQRNLDHITLYRSRLACLRNFRRFAGNAVRRDDRRLRLWLHAPERRTERLGRLATILLRWRRPA